MRLAILSLIGVTGIVVNFAQNGRRSELMVQNTAITLALSESMETGFLSSPIQRRLRRMITRPLMIMAPPMVCAIEIDSPRHNHAETIAMMGLRF